MPFKPLMCVWQAVFARDDVKNGEVATAMVKKVTEAMQDVPGMQYQEDVFVKTFTQSTVLLNFVLFYRRAYKLSDMVS